MEQFQIETVVDFAKRCNLRCVKLFIVSVANAVFQLLFGVISEKTAHNGVCGLLIRHFSQLFCRDIKRRDLFRNVKSAVICESL